MFHNHTSFQDDETDLPWILFGLCLCLLVGSCIGVFSYMGRIPGPEFHFGAIIRQQAEHVRAIRARKERRHHSTKEERHTQIQQHLHTMHIVARESHTGYYRLAESEQHQQQQELVQPRPIGDGGSVVDLVEEKKTFMRHTNPTLPCTSSTDDICCPTFTIVTKPSTDTTTDNTQATNLDSDSNSDSDSDTFDVESQSDSNHNNMNVSTDTDEDDDYVCQICLDRFEIGDTVMFQKQPQPVEIDTLTNRKANKNESNKSSDSNSECESISSSSSSFSFSPKKKLGSNSTSKSSSCGHVFHQACIMAWLFEKRENECPSCRSIYIPTSEKDDQWQQQQGNNHDDDNDIGVDVVVDDDDVVVDDVDDDDENEDDDSVHDTDDEKTINKKVEEKITIDTISDDAALTLELELEEVDLETGIMPTNESIIGCCDDTDHWICHQEDKERSMDNNTDHTEKQNNSNYDNDNGKDTDTFTDTDHGNHNTVTTYYIANGRIRILVR